MAKTSSEVTLHVLALLSLCSPESLLGPASAESSETWLLSRILVFLLLFVSGPHLGDPMKSLVFIIFVIFYEVDKY